MLSFERHLAFLVERAANHCPGAGVEYLKGGYAERLAKALRDGGAPADNMTRKQGNPLSGAVREAANCAQRLE